MTGSSRCSCSGSRWAAASFGTHYDGAAFDRFDAARDDVETGGMGPAFGNGQWTEGMLAGLEGYAAAYDGPAPTSDPTSGPDDLGTGTGWSGSSDALPWVLGVPAGLAAVGGAGYGGLRLRRTLKARASARATLATSVGQMAQAWFELDESNELIDARVAALPPVSDRVADDIRAAHAEAVTTRTAATDTYLRMSDVFTATTIARTGTDDALHAAEEVDGGTRDLRAAQAAMAGVEERLTAYDTLREELPSRIAGLRAQAAEVTGLLAARQGEGYRTGDNDPAPQAAEAAATSVEALVAEQRHGDAAALLAGADADLAAHRTWLTELDAFRAALVRDAAQLRSRAAGLDRELADAYVTTEDLERDQDPSCVTGIRETVDRAAADRRALDVQLTTLEDHSSMATQQFARAREEITAAQQSVEAITTGAAAPALRVEQLRALSVDLPQRAERAVVEADAVQGQVGTHPAAMTYVAELPDVSALRADAVSVGEDAAQPRPAWLRLDERLGEVEAGLTRARAVVEQAISDHEASQRALDGAASAVAAAQGEVRDSDVSDAARQLLEEAQALLARAEQETGSLAAITSGAVGAKGKADAAAARARQDRRDAEQRRAAARRAAEASRRSSAAAASAASAAAREAAVGHAAAAEGPAAAAEGPAASAAAGVRDAPAVAAPAGSDPADVAATVLP